MANNNNNNQNDDDKEFYLLRDYISKCPFFNSNSNDNNNQRNEEHPAIAAALQGIDRELRQRARDRVLHTKFQQKVEAKAVEGTLSATDAAGTSNNINSNEHEKRIRLSSDTNDPSFLSNDDTNMDDWEDVAAEQNDSDDNDNTRMTTATAWGKEMAQAAIATLAEQRVRVQEPLEAMTLLLHAVLLQHGFLCTGIPETAPTTGFAAPVRPLTTFLPQPWVPNKEQITLRYRNESVFFLTTRQETDTEKNEPRLHITLSQERSSNSSTQDVPTLSFPLSQHFNLESFARATKPSEPILHYKQITDLLSQFGSVFDLGQYKVEGIDKQPYVDCTVASLPTRQSAPLLLPTQNPPVPVSTRSESFPDVRPSFATIGPDGRPSFHLGQPMPHHPGDFAGDLFPSPQFPGLIHPGNLMGPDHPMFGGNGSGHGGMSMQPRFDPFGPVITDPRRQPPPEGVDPRGGGRRQFPGEPNPDHLAPPNSFNSNMYL